MELPRKMVKWAAVMGVLVFAAECRGSATISQAIDDVAGYLMNHQAANGSWAGAEAYTGVIVAGLVNSYQIKGDTACKTAAEEGGTYILNSAFGNFYGDEAYGLTRLSEISADPSNNVWRSELSTFYDTSVGNTALYISDLVSGVAEDSLSLFYLAHHAVAAEYVNAADKAIWRQGVIDTLAGLDDTDMFPVMGLGAAVFALAQTDGGLDTTLVSLTGDWAGIPLAALPGILAGHQVADGAYRGSFYWRLDHGDDMVSAAEGYTEDSVYGALGLLAADADGAFDYTDEILMARAVLTNGDSYGVVPPDLGVQSSGVVYDHIWYPSYAHYAFMGETLQALPEPASVTVMLLGALGLARRRKRRQHNRHP